jgi:hypothetical protein
MEIITRFGRRFAKSGKTVSPTKYLVGKITVGVVGVIMPECGNTDDVIIIPIAVYGQEGKAIFMAT